MKKTILKTLLFCLIVFVQPQVSAQDTNEAVPANEPVVGTISNTTPNKLQKPLGRIKSTTGVNSESSSFMGDPDNIDPLNPNRENLKEDEEPVLEDIKQIIDAPKKKKDDNKALETGALPEASGASADATVAEPTPPPPVELTPAPVESSSEPVVARKKERPSVPGLLPDDPDYNLEKRFNNIFRRYNINPTPDDIWSAATAKQVLREYIVQKGDTLWSISKILFDDANFWPKIWAINKQGILNPHFIYPNSKIYFYMGDEESAPTLSVGSPSEPKPDVEEGAEQPETTESTETAAEAGQTEDQGGETGKSKAVLGRPKEPPPPPVAKKSKSERPARLPRSLPLHRNGLYFAPSKIPDIKIDLGEFPRFDFQISSDIVITDRVVKTDVLLKIAETTKFRCYEGRIIRDIRYIGQLVEDYDIFERLNDIKTTAGIMHAYRLYGRAQPYQGKYLRIANCKSLLLSDLIIVAKEKILTYKNKQISPTRNAVLIGGPDVVDQKLFAPNQVAYIDFGNTAYEPGQDFKIVSKITDEVNGVAKVLEKFGSFGVVMLTDINDLIEIGDKVTN